jgi:DNA-directed RNA polymerase I, II, and III subunit RPABC1
MSRKIIYNMLTARGYEITKDFIEENEETSLFNKIDDSDKIYIFYPNISKKVGVSTIRTYIEEMENNEVNNAIIVVKDAVSAFSKKEFARKKDLNVEYFKENELLIDITEHVYVPKHILISESEKKELLKKYKIKADKIPKIHTSDPVARYYGAKKGQVFKIIRSSETSVETLFYRIVI